MQLPTVDHSLASDTKNDDWRQPQDAETRCMAQISHAKTNMKTISRRKLLKVGAALSLAAIPKMVHSQVLAPRRVTPTHWNMIHNHADRTLAPDWLRQWVATMVREPERRIPGLLVVGPQVSGKTTLHRAFGSLLPFFDYHVNETFRGQELSALVGKRTLNVLEDDDCARDPLFTDHGRHEEFIGKLLSKPGSEAHWIETCQHQYVEAGPWLKLIRLDPLRTPLPANELFARLNEERDAFLDSLGRYDLMESLKRVPASQAQLLRKIA